MAKDETHRLIPSVIQANKDAYNALTNIKNYSPANAAYKMAALTAAFNDMLAKQAAETQALASYKAARDNVNAAEWAFHNLILGTKDQVIAQFGKDSNEAQAIGLKKKSEYKKPARKNGKSGNSPKSA
jgi:hypothetical protein